MNFEIENIILKVGNFQKDLCKMCNYMHVFHNTEWMYNVNFKENCGLLMQWTKTHTSCVDGCFSYWNIKDIFYHFQKVK